MRNHVSITLSVIAIVLSVWAVASQDRWRVKNAEKQLLVRLDNWPAEKFEVGKNENQDDSVKRKISINIVNGSQDLIKCFVQVNGKGFVAGTHPENLLRTYVSPLIELAGIGSGANRKTIDLIMGPSDRNIYGLGPDDEYYLDVKVVSYSSREILFRRLCYYFYASEGDENLHLHRPMEILPADDIKYKYCECIPEPIK